MTEPLRCTTVDSYGQLQFFDGKILVFVALGDGSFVERRHRLGYDPPFRAILPCPYCGVEEDRNHDKRKHVDTHLATRMAP